MVVACEEIRNFLTTIRSEIYLPLCSYIATNSMDLTHMLHINGLLCFYDWRAGVSQPSHATGGFYMHL